MSNEKNKQKEEMKRKNNTPIITGATLTKT